MVSKSVQYFVDRNCTAREKREIKGFKVVRIPSRLSEQFVSYFVQQEANNFLRPDLYVRNKDYAEVLSDQDMAEVESDSESIEDKKIKLRPTITPINELVKAKAQSLLIKSIVRGKTKVSKVADIPSLSTNRIGEHNEQVELQNVKSEITALKIVSRAKVLAARQGLEEIKNLNVPELKVKHSKPSPSTLHNPTSLWASLVECTSFLVEQYE